MPNLNSPFRNWNDNGYKIQVKVLRKNLTTKIIHDVIW
jgi:hypothetical protein